MYKQFSIFDYSNNDILIDGCIYQNLSFEPYVIGVLHIISEHDVKTYSGDIVHCYNCSIIDKNGHYHYFGNHAAKDFLIIY